MTADIPIEILLHILSFLPNDELSNVMLVNMDFYRYCAKKLSFKNELVLNKTKLDDKSIVDSMSNSLRRFDHLTIELDNYNCLNLISLQDILQNIGEKIGLLDLTIDTKNVEVKQSVLISWLNTMPNLEKLRFFGSFKSAVNEILDDSTTELKIRKLILVCFCPLGLGLKLHQTPNACIEILRFDDKTPLPNIEQVFETHRETLHTLELFKTVYSDPLPFRQLKLSTFMCHYREYMNNSIHNAFLMDFIEHQTNLRILELGIDGDKMNNCYPVNSELMNLICKQTQLEEISMGLNSDITPNDIYQLKNLRNLNSLLLHTSFNDFDVSLEVLEAIAITKIPSLKIFRLEADFNDVSQHLIQRMGESFPYLEEFTGSYGISTIDADFKTFNVFLDSFPHLTSLDLIETDYVFFPGNIYPKMKKLLMFNDTEVFLSPQFIESMPNLEEIHIGNMVAQNATLMAILISKIKKVDIKLSIDEENMSEEELKVCQEIVLMIKNKGAEFIVEFFEDEEDSELMIAE